MPHKKVVLALDWWISKWKCASNANNICMEFIFTNGENISPKSKPAICVNHFATKCVLYLLILPFEFWFVFYFKNPFACERFSILE